ncbi:MAG: VOC family protein [Pseudomonadota bacterium]
MNKGNLEHVNITVKDPERTAELLCKLFDWDIRWSGQSQFGGFTVHVGTDSDYLALYGPEDRDAIRPFSKTRAGRECGGLNHIAVTVDDLSETERRVRQAGMKPVNHADYEPGKRFYFYDHDGIEYEVVSYVRAASTWELASLMK